MYRDAFFIKLRQHSNKRYLCYSCQACRQERDIAFSFKKFCRTAFVFRKNVRDNNNASAKSYVRQYRATFGKTPGVWGSFTYDSARILFAAIGRAKSYSFAAVERQLRATKRYRGATGAITIDRKTGYRATVPVSILRVDNRKRFVIAK